MKREILGIRIWLLVGLIMVYVQIILGGITRLTGSGLSITRWEIVTGVVPPLNEKDWQSEFNAYKETPQYNQLNRGMEVQEFKFIYLWEYVHRLWARSIGIVFLIPFIFFLLKGQMNKWLLRRSVMIFLLGGFVGLFGWIMVSSGLVDRPWVNAYKLTMHLLLALIVFSYLFVTFLDSCNVRAWHVSRTMKRGFSFILALTVIQIALGGLMAGMKAALFFPTFPGYHGSFFPQVLIEQGTFSVENFIDYDNNPWMPALIQIMHRSVAYILIISMLVFSVLSFKEWKGTGKQGYLFLWNGLLIIQIIVGVTTLIRSIGRIPLLWGVVHQAIGIIYLSLCLYFIYITIVKSTQSKSLSFKFSKYDRVSCNGREEA